jgi:DNA-binding transcriptional ArsR family regulator
MTEKEKYGRIARKFKALAHPARLKLLEKIATERCCVSEIERCLSISQPNVSQHLKILKREGIIRGEREKRRICYRISDTRVRGLLKDFLKGER